MQRHTDRTVRAKITAKGQIATSYRERSCSSVNNPLVNKLSAEIRNQIYEYIFSESSVDFRVVDPRYEASLLLRDPSSPMG